MSEVFLRGKVELHCGDCLDVLATLPENSVDSCVTDPPYHLTSIVKRFGKDGSAAAQYGTDGRFQRVSRGFMSKEWDGGDIAQSVDLWREVLRVLKPGGHLLAFGGTRTYHRMACAIEDAGFEIRDCVQWLYGSGFPKSHDVSKGIDRAAGAEREVVGFNPDAVAKQNKRPTNDTQCTKSAPENVGILTAPAPAPARQWEGWGTALKPANEPICLARKPLSEGAVAANVLRWGTGAINVDGCRVALDEAALAKIGAKQTTNKSRNFGVGDYAGPREKIEAIETFKSNGRWPANVIHDGSEEVIAGFPESGPANGAPRNNNVSLGSSGSNVFGKGNGFIGAGHEDNGGSAARFFYTAKADSDDRLGSKHPTVKPLDLMQYLVRLVTSKGGVCLDPFAGTGTTGEAAWREGMRAILIEREAEYQRDLRRRMELAMSGPDERTYQSAKARQGDKAPDYGPLFDRQKWNEMWAKPFDNPELL